MNTYREALKTAAKEGFLTVGSGGRWLDVEVLWRRQCQSWKVPAVVVSPREKYADVYMLLRGFPHQNPSDGELDGLIDEIEDMGIRATQVSVMHGEPGHHDRFTGISVSDVPINDALSLAPLFVQEGLGLVPEDSIA